MLGKLCAPLVVFAVFLGTASAGEENLMAMRGAAPDGRPGVNRFSPAKLAGRERMCAVSTGAYMGWRDSCVRGPAQVAGMSIRVDGPGGFGLAQPLPKRPVPGEQSSLELFLHELTRE